MSIPASHRRPLFRKSLFALLFAAAVLLSGCGGSRDGTASAPTPVRVERSWLGPAHAPIAANGVIAARDEMRLSFKVGGVMRRIAVQPGQAVRKGQLLAEIDTTEIDAEVAGSRELADKAARDLARGERLQADQVISQEQLQDLRTQDAVAQATLRATRFNRSHAVIIAPADGTVLRKLVEERELVPVGQPVLMLGARDGGYVIKCALSDRDVVQLRLGDAVVVTLDAFAGQEFKGNVREIAAAADPSTGLFPMEAQLADPPAQLASGMVAKLRMVPADAGAPQRVYVPNLAVIEGDRQQAFVYLLQDGRAVRRAVQVAFITNEAVALAAGLPAEAPVITEGALFLKDRDAVREVGATPAAAGAGGAARAPAP